MAKRINMDKEIIIDNIDKYLSFYTDFNVISRGLKLFEKGKVNFLHYQKNTKKIVFEVQGTKLYKTTIKGVEDLAIETSCSCPYTWGTVCKHSVAALLYYKEYLVGNESGILTNKKIEYRKSDEYIVISDYKKITNNTILSLTDPVKTKRSYGSYEISNVIINDDSIIFYVENNRGYYYDYEEITVTFQYKNDHVRVNSEDGTRVISGKLRPAEIFVLNDISKTASNLFELLFEQRKKLTDYYEKNMTLRKGTFDDFMELVYVEGKGVMATYKEDAPIILSKTKESKIQEVIKTISDFSFDNVIVDLKNRKTKEKRVAFAIGSEHDNLGYYAIQAKPNKTETKLVSKFDFIDEDDDFSEILITDEQKSIVKWIETFDEESDEYADNFDLFKLSKQIFQAIANEKFTYFFDGNDSWGRLRKSELTPIKLSKQTVKSVVNVRNKSGYISVGIAFKIDNEIVLPDDKSVEILSNMIRYKDVYYHFNNIQDYLLIDTLHKEIWVPEEEKEILFQQVLKPFSKEFEINFSDNTFDYQKIELDFKKEQIYLSENDNYIIIQPQVVYDNDISILLRNNGNIFKKDDTGTLLEYVRNDELEQDFINTIADLHPDFEMQKSDKFFYLHIDDFTKDMWFYHFFDVLNEKNIEIFGLKNLKNFKYSPYKGKIATSVSSGQDWFDVSIDVSFGNTNVSLNDIRKAVVNKQKYIQLKDGSVGIMPDEWLHKLEKYFRNGVVKKDKLEISKLRFSVIDELFDEIDETKIIEELAEKRQRIAGFTQINKTKVPRQILADLRPYQKEGLNWLNFLDEMKWGGILADDMGLGKTLQILTFIQHILKKDKTTNLVVVPTTLLFNWKAEIEKFAPKIKAHYHYGANRKKDVKLFDKHHIVFTTYGTLLRDIEFLKDYQFNYVILDESQAIKNPVSRRYKAANLLKAKNRIAMTGTPIENGTFDLYAQMNFVNPGLFGSVKNFKESYANPIDKDANEMIAFELQKIIKPFVLRRTKENVAKELPPKIEDVIYCEMTPEQQRIYDAYRNEYRNKLLKNVEKKGIGKSKMMVLEALTRLRQICDSPALIDSIDYDEKAIKIKEIVEHITEKTAKHKVLIFSQFVKMLHLIKDELDRLNISYEYLDGKSSSKQREQSVDNFQNNKDLRVFLISLKAGGTGLNLTAADYVYIMDPWWNPAVENQAIDRVYRIGQDKNVFAYRMICKNTVEEKILNLQTKKKKIATDIIQTDENMMKNLTVDDINDLLS